MDPLKLMSQMDGYAAEIADDPAAQAQLRDFWAKLDSLAEKDPQEYARFMQQQLSAGMEEFKDLETQNGIAATHSYTVKTYTQGKKEVVVVNVCHSTK